MRIGILSRNSKLYSIRRLKAAATAEGHEIVFVSILRCALLVDTNLQRVFTGDKDVPKIDVLLPRIGTTVTSYGVTLVRQFEHMGVPVVNSGDSIEYSRDKFRCMQVLSDHGIRVPRTILTRTPESALRAIELAGGAPVVLKMLSGTQGVGVIVAESVDSAESMIETLWHLGQDIQIQKFISESRGRDIRAFVIGDEVVAAMRREAADGSFRANIHRGAEGVAISLTEEEEDLALRTTEVLGLNVAGVDIIESKDGPMVLEANSSPGFEGLERATRRDIAGEIVRFVADFGRRKGR